jgi:hypothetical protein
MKRHKLLRRIAALSLLTTLLSCLVAFHLYRGAPSWYTPASAAGPPSPDAANSADQKLLDLFSWAAGIRAQQLRQLSGHAKPTDAPIEAKTITLSDTELNAFLGSWSTPGMSDLQERISRYFSNGQVGLQNGAIIFAGDSPSMGAVLSAEFDPSIDADGNLRVDLASLSAGRLPIPKSAVGSQLDRLRQLLKEQLDDEKPYVAIAPSLTANSAAFGACWLKLLLSALDNTPANSILIVPFDMSNLNHGVPVNLTAISVTDGKITLTFQPIASDDRAQLVNRLKEP